MTDTNDISADAKTLEIGRPPLPSYHVEDEPTVAVGGAPTSEAAPRTPREGRARTPREPREPRAPREAEEVRTDDPAFTNVFLNVGRRDGLETEDIQRIVVDNAKLSAEDVGHVRLRDRITFVGIRKEHAEEAIKALIGVTVGERTLNAEPARDR